LPNLPVIDAKEAERRFFSSGVSFVRSKGSHRIYMKGKSRVVFLFIPGKLYLQRLLNRFWSLLLRMNNP